MLAAPSSSPARGTDPRFVAAFVLSCVGTSLLMAPNLPRFLSPARGIESPKQPADPLAVPMGPYAATVVSVHDGDTATLRISLSFGVSVTESIRIYSINAAELHKGDAVQRGEGAAARDYLMGLLPPGVPVRLTVARNASGKQVQTFARYVGRIERRVKDAAVDVAGEMVGAGYARWCDADLNPLFGPPPPLPTYTPTP